MQNNYLTIRNNFYKEVYETELSNFNIDLNSFKYNPYTKIKSYYYIEIGALLIYFLIKTNIRPNSITLFYAFLGPVGALLFSFNSIQTTFLALFIFFSKSIPDWMDGHIARLKNQESVLGALLDEWGAIVNLLCFQIGVTLYIVNVSGQTYYYLIGLIIVILNALDLKNYIDRVTNHTNEKSSLINYNNSIKLIKNKFHQILSKIIILLRYNGRSRYTDLVIFIIILELYYGQLIFSFIFMWVWLLISILKFFYSIKKSFEMTL